MFHKIISYLFLLNFKTIYYNLKWFGFKDGKKLPVMVSSNCLIEGSGKLIIDAPIKPLMIKIGYGDVGIFHKKNKFILRNYGLLRFKGVANIGHGSKISIDKGGELVLGDDFIITAESSIVCHKKIEFGSQCLISWEVLIMDDDLHQIYDKEGYLLNESKPIRFGSKVWVGARSTILKGVFINDNSIVASNSVITKTFKQKNVVIGGHPNKILKKDIKWVR